MSRTPLKLLLATSVVATLALGVVGTASAAPMTNVLRGADVQAPAAQQMVQKAYWVWHHHHRVWVSPHRH